MADPTLDQLGAALQRAHEAGDVEAAQQLAAEYKRVQSASSTPPAGERAEAAAGLRQEPEGPSFRIASPKARVEKDYNPNVVPAIALTAPARAVTGIADFAYEAPRALGRWAGMKIDKGEEPLTPMVDRLTDALAGQHVGESVPRAAFEGVLTGPMMGGKAANLSKALAGGAAGGTGEAVTEAGGNPLTALIAALVAGHGAGKLPSAATLSPAELLAKSRIQKATRGIPEQDYAPAQAAMDNATAEGRSLLPSQAFPEGAPGVQRLQEALMQGNSPRAQTMTATALGQPREVTGMLGDLLGKVGEQRGVTQQALADAQDLIRNSGAATAQIAPNIGERLARLEMAKALNWDKPDVVAALDRASKVLSALKGRKEVTAENIDNLLQAARSKIPEGSRAADTVNENLRFLDDLVNRVAPDLRTGRRMAAATEGPMTAQNQLTSALQSASRRSTTTGLPQPNQGLKAQNWIDPAMVDTAFKGNPAAAEGFNRLLEVAANASKPVVAPRPGAPMSGFEALEKTAFGTLGQKINMIARIQRALTGGVSDRAALAVLQRPDVIQRLEAISKMSPEQITPAVLANALPNLETPNGP